jgi:hypothetical protein
MKNRGSGNAESDAIIRRIDDEDIVDTFAQPFMNEFDKKGDLEKMRFFFNMNDELMAVFGFHLYYKQASVSFHEFKYRTLHFILTGFFEEVIRSARHCKDDKMADLLKRIRKEICEPLSEEVNSEKKAMNLEALFTELKNSSVKFYHTLSDIVRNQPEKLTGKQEIPTPTTGFSKNN